MSVFKSFTMFDYHREYFVLLIKKFENSKKWAEIRGLLEKKLIEEKKKPEENFTMESELGIFLCSYDKHNKCYFILQANQKIIKEEHAQLLQTIKEKIMKIDHFIKLNRVQLSEKVSKDINDMLKEAEDKYIQTYGELENIMTQQQLLEKKYRKELVNEIMNKKAGHTAIEQIKRILISQCIETNSDVVKIKAFTMFDYARQFFFLTVNNQKPVSKKWFDDRNLIQKHILDNQKKPPPEFELKGEDGNVFAKYDKDHKCYFILYFDQTIPLQEAAQIIERVYCFINKIPKYIKLKKEEIEGKYLEQVKSIVKQEDSHQEKDFQNIIDQNQVKLVCSPQGFSKIEKTQLQSDLLQKQTVSKIVIQKQEQFEETQPLVKEAQY